MKTNIVRQCSLGLSVGLIFSLGCARPKAQSPATVVEAPPPAMVAQAAPVAVDGPAVAPTGQDTNPPAILERIPASRTTETTQMSPGLSEVVKLAQAGVGEEVILAYIEKYSGHFDLGAEQILYLNDLGVSSTVMTAMLKHDGRPETDLAALATNAAAPDLTANAPANPPTVTAPLTPTAEQTTVSTAVAPPPTSSDVAYFYDALSPYGSWVYLSGYGWCWQPTVAVSVPTWRPYCDRGRWYWSDAGWYWYSDYSWGWAAFHYGRWYHHAGSGWVWRPGLAWGPSWVSWRYYDGYCGWAPLPPEAHFVYGSGFTYYGRHVAVGFDFGLAPFHYTFVGVNNFCDYAPYRYVVPHTRVNHFYRHTTVVNNYVVRNNRHVVNHGIGRETIARSSTTRIREVSVRETPVNNMARVRGDRIERQGNQMVVYRPQLPKDPPVVRSAQFARRTDGSGQTGTTTGRNGNISGSGTGRGNATVTRPENAPTSTRGQGSRGQSAVTARPSGNDADVPRTQPRSIEERKPVTNQRGNPTRTERSRPDDSKPAVVTPRRQSEPAVRPQTQQQNAPLFGSDAATARPQNNVAASRPGGRLTPLPAPRVQARPSQNNAAANPVYPRTATPVQPGYTPQAQSGSHGAMRNYSDHSSMPPRQTEQIPRYTAPLTPSQRSYQAPQSAPQSPSHPAAGRYSAPQNARPDNQVHSAPRSGGERSSQPAPRSGGDSGSRGGGGRGDGGGGRGEGGRNR